ncbi:MAG: hypothetical protein AB1324_02800 [Candidatus Micrarchaeota archaeon]
MQLAIRRAQPEEEKRRISAMPLHEGPAGRGYVKLEGYEGADIPRLASLLESGFGRKLVPGYFELPASLIVLDAEYRGVGIVKEMFGESYLDKFTVHPDARGFGIARDIWAVLKEQHGSLIWRSRKDNPINCWYRKNSDASVDTGKWTVFWYGIDAERASALVPQVAALPETLK